MKGWPDSIPSSKGEAAQYLENLSDNLREVPRLGGREDNPEGSRWIEISETLAQLLADRLDMIIIILRSDL